MACEGSNIVGTDTKIVTVVDATCTLIKISKLNTDSNNVQRDSLVNNRDPKHQNGSHADGIPEVYFLSQSYAEPEKLIAICRRPDVGDATFTVFT